MKPGRHTTRIGITIGAQAVTAVARSGAVVRDVAVPLLYDGADIAAALGPALLEIRARLEATLGATTTSAAVHVALLPPLAETRLLALPPLRAADAEAVVRRDGGRYFMGVPAPRVVAVRTTPRNRSAPVTAAAANATFVEAVRSAVAGAGWRAASLVPSHAAWVAAARDRGEPHVLIAVAGDTAHIVQLRNGAALSLRRLPAAALAEIVAAAAEAATARNAPVAVFADAPLRAALAHDLTAAGLSPMGLSAPAAEAAARFAHAAALPLVPLTALAERRDREKRVALQLAVAAAVLVLATAAIELWGARRQLDAVRGRRAEIRAAVAPLLMLRDSVQQLDANMAELEMLARTTPRWTGALFDIALLLPPETYLTRLFATGDTLIIDAEGARAGIALQALRGAGTLRDARLLGSIERELADGSTTIERFRLSARLASAQRTSLARADTAESGR